MTAPRYPLEPLAAALRIELHRPGRPTDDDQADYGLTVIADLVGCVVGGRKLRRIVNKGLEEPEADYCATRIGMHPASIWPQWWEAAGDDADWYTDDPALESLRPPHRLSLIVAP